MKYECLKCSYTTTSKRTYDKHLLSNKHLKPFVSCKYECSTCSFGTDVSSRYAHHCKTDKHIRLCKPTDFVCMCGMTFHSSKALTYHSKECETAEMEPTNDMEPTNEPTTEPTTEPTNEPVIEQEPEQETGDEKMERMIAEAISKLHPQTVNNNTDNSHTNSHNKVFNISVFLNNECSEALDMSAFVESIQVTLEDLQMATVDGVAASVKAVLRREMSKLDVTKRPIHCTDRKRKALFMKEGGVWQKNETNCQPLQDAIDEIGNKSKDRVAEWMRNCTDGDGKINNDYNKAMLATYAQTFWANPMTSAARVKVITDTMNGVYVGGLNVPIMNPMITADKTI